ncbi:MAG TPA: DUF3276 family protein [Candidatus Acidoferrales bacterium]|nr:DUF3276 family protein [Candidatus Acidoferrales bacterium]
MGKENEKGITIPAGQRTYFIDVKEAKNGNKYLVFTESKKNTEGKFDKQRIMVFSDHFKAIYEAMKQVAPEFGINL